MALPDRDLPRQRQENGALAGACNLGVEHRRRVRQRRDARLEPHGLAVRAFAGTADADPRRGVARADAAARSGVIVARIPLATRTHSTPAYA